MQEAEDNQMRGCNQNEAYSVEEKDGSIMEIVRECMMMLTYTEVQEFCDFEIDEFVNHEENLEKQDFVSVIYEDETTSFCCNGIST